jgi:hypothetical protein
MDCNLNGVPDECDISSGTSHDYNHNGVPDECEPPVIPGDFDYDGDVDNNDFGLFEDCTSGPNTPLIPGCEDKDLDIDNDVDQEDYGVFQRCISGDGNPGDPNCAD